MKPVFDPCWNVNREQAIQWQRELSERLILVDQWDSDIKYVAGVDVGFEEQGQITRAAVVVLRYPELEVVEAVVERCPTTFPYVPGLLSFRELPAVLAAFAQVKQVPDLLLCDGQGIAHPRRLGIASHLGLLLDKPSIGVAKSRLYGSHVSVANQRGAWVPLLAKKEIIGAVLRTRVNTKPLYISAGHRISLATAIHYVMTCCPRYRLPETIRQAHRRASLDKTMS